MVLIVVTGIFSASLMDPISTVLFSLLKINQNGRFGSTGRNKIIFFTVHAELKK